MLFFMNSFPRIYIEKMIRRIITALAIIIGLVFFWGVINVITTTPAQAFEDDLCKFYKAKLDEALNNCDLEKISDLKTMTKKINSFCIDDVVKKVLVKYNTKCFKSKLSKIVYDCNLDLLFSEEKIINSRRLS